ncbi:MAG: Na+/H+ antiporter subunit E [Thermodesulfobacteriota bacterium]|nr:Na+/H+ antiporter subunit E [Thermodesulfobacteriota bacterium]
MKTDRRKTGQKKGVFIITFLILFLFWVVFSGKFDGFHLSLGAVSCLIVSWFTSDLLLRHPKLSSLPLLWKGFLIYMPWLLWQIILANIHLMKIVFSQDIASQINPHLIRFKSRIKEPVGLVTFANSITLTPGTITVSLSVYGDMVVHAVDDESASPLPGEMEKRVAQIFGE